MIIHFNLTLRDLMDAAVLVGFGLFAFGMFLAVRSTRP
jgi:hypothetical protein